MRFAIWRVLPASNPCMLVPVAGKPAPDGASLDQIRTSGIYSTKAPATPRDLLTFMEGDSMSRLLIASVFLMGMMISATGAATAQETGTDVDVAATGEAVLAADPDALVTGLETPPDDALLPEGFMKPASGVSENAEIAEQLAGTILDVANLDGVLSNVSYGFDTDPSTVPGLLSAGVIAYIVTDTEITAEDFDSYEDRAGQGLEGGTPEAEAEAASKATPTTPPSEANVQRIDFGGGEAVVVTVGVELGAVNAVVQIVAVPVGNTMVIGTVLIADQGEVDQEQVLGFAEALTLAGVEHIGTVAEGAQ